MRGRNNIWALYLKQGYLVVNTIKKSKYKSNKDWR